MVGTFVRIAIPAMWIAWAAYWWAVARGTKRTRWREAPGAQALHTVPFVLCMAFLVSPRWQPAALTARFVSPGPVLPLLGMAVVAAGFLLAIWARVHLGRNWSSHVVVKEDHALVRTGPYRAIRHPIYTGLLLAVAGTACAIGEWRGVFAFACVLFGILARVRAEEARMGETFPEYAAYKRESSALVPGLF